VDIGSAVDHFAPGISITQPAQIRALTCPSVLGWGVGARLGSRQPSLTREEKACTGWE
jgi:hypothetical protein